MGFRKVLSGSEWSRGTCIEKKLWIISPPPVLAQVSLNKMEHLIKRIGVCREACMPCCFGSLEKRWDLVFFKSNSSSTAEVLKAGVGTSFQESHKKLGAAISVSVNVAKLRVHWGGLCRTLHPLEPVLQVKVSESSPLSYAIIGIALLPSLFPLSLKGTGGHLHILEVVAPV